MPVHTAPAILLAAAAMAIGGAEPARAWRMKTAAGLPIFRGVIAIAPDGDVLADVGAGQTIDDRSILLERHDGRFGKRRWRQGLAAPDGGGGAATALRATPDGDVVGVGYWGSGVQRMLAFRVGDRGTPRWIRELDGGAAAPFGYAATSVCLLYTSPSPRDS